MTYRRLGKTELQVSVLGLGCGRLGSVTQGGGDKAALRLVEFALDSGISFFDTADVYGQGASERLLAKALKGRGEKVVVATKAGFCLGSLGVIARRLKPLLRRFLKLRPGFARSIKQVRAAQQRQDFSADHLKTSIEASLRRLERESLDLFFLHSPPGGTLRHGEVFETLAQLKTEGKLRHYGVSCRCAADAEVCLKQAGVELLQVELNPLTFQALAETLPAARARDVGLVARQALAGGLLLRPSEELRPEDCAARGWSLADAKRCVDTMETLARETGVSRTQVAVRFLLGLEGVSSVLTGTLRPEHLQEQLAALECPALGPQILARLHIPAASGLRAGRDGS